MSSSILRWISQKKVGGNSLLRGICSGILRSGSGRAVNSPTLLMHPTGGGNDGDMVFKSQNIGGSRSVGKLELKLGSSSEIVGSSHGWLCLVDEREVVLLNPVSGRRINLPPVPNTQEEEERGALKKVILSCSPQEEECRAVMDFGTHQAFCWPRRSTEWTTFVGYDGDFAFMSGHKFFCIQPPDGPLWKDFMLMGWDLKDPTSPLLDWSVNDYRIDLPFVGHLTSVARLRGYGRDPNWHSIKVRCFKHHYLVVSPLQQWELFHVIRYIDPLMQSTIDFDVNKINVENGGINVENVENGGKLDGLVMYVGGVNDSVAMAASSDGFPPPNSICFTDELWWYNINTQGHDNGIYNYEKKAFLPLNYHCPCDYPCDYLNGRITGGVYLVRPNPS